MDFNVNVDSISVHSFNCSRKQKKPKNPTQKNSLNTDLLSHGELLILPVPCTRIRCYSWHDKIIKNGITCWETQAFSMTPDTEI